ncbi:MAG: nuclear transport factor 2 family protein [Proteobacteria bacterium]|nr:nuclear transport factor 2 family protein [Pseudomonadota bacterium]
MDRDTKRAIEWDCAQVLLRFYDAFDAWDYPCMVALCTDDVVWHRAGKVLAGRPAIVAELELRPANQTIRHVVTNLLVDVRGVSKADARFYLTAYRYQGAGQPSVPAPMQLPALLLIVTARLVSKHGIWRIAEQVMRREFVRANDETPPASSGSHSS